MEDIRIYMAENRMEAEMVAELLANNGIPSYRKSIGSGDIMEIYGRSSLFGEEIWVNEAQAEEAAELLSQFTVK